MAHSIYYINYILFKVMSANLHEQINRKKIKIVAHSTSLLIVFFVTYNCTLSIPGLALAFFLALYNIKIIRDLFISNNNEKWDKVHELNENKRGNK